MIDANDFAMIMAMLAALYPRFTLTPEVLTAYRGILDDLPVDLLRAAALQIGATSKWFPAASELRTAAFELIERQQGVPSAPEAWAEVCKEIRRVGWCGTPAFSHLLVQKAVDSVGGWMQLCQSEQPVADRARFLDGYTILLQRAQTETRTPPAVAEAVKQIAARMRDKLLTRGEKYP